MADALALARKAVEVASDKQASDVLLLDLRDLSAFTDFFVILSAETARHLDALARDLAEALEREGAVLHHREGSAEAGWVVLDFGEFVVHLFTPEEREYYRLEALWSRATPLLRVQ